MRWTQLIFLKLWEAGLAYRAMALVNWCPECETVLANEQVDDGPCWRWGTAVRKRELEQWFLRITRYADELLDGDRVAASGLARTSAHDAAQLDRPLGGRARALSSRGPIAGHDAIDVFTTRPDTLYGVTFLSIAPEHPIAERAAPERPPRGAVSAFLEAMSTKTDLERSAEHAPKEGVFTGIARHPSAHRSEAPVCVGSFVLMGYGTGAVMAVPAHDSGTSPSRETTRCRSRW